MTVSDRRWATFAAVTTAVVVASLLPVLGGGPERFLLDVGLDKWAHSLGYAAVSLTFARAWSRTAVDGAAAGGAWRIGIGAIVLGFAVGAGVELLQTVVATRAAAVADAAANAVGAAGGALLWRLRNR